MSDNNEFKQIEKEMADLEVLYRSAYQEREQVRQQYVDLLVKLIQVAKVDDDALSMLIQCIRSERTTKEVVNALVLKWIASME